jgi:hypothetical protein
VATARYLRVVVLAFNVVYLYVPCI